eukprot:GGOE01030836.1.p1 GENE.GGOE01030836.1~~GGOE01030836.1.p1  ORF type:complete len:774 (-),score=238.79 GGOE01030836.1:367-2688(-)
MPPPTGWPRSRAMINFNLHVAEGENELLVQQAIVGVSGLLNYDLRPPQFDIQGRMLTPLQTRNFEIMNGHPYFTSISLTAAIWPNGSTTSLARRLAAQVWGAMYMDIPKGTLGQHTLYYTCFLIQPDMQMINVTITYADQDSGELLIPIQEQPLLPANSFDYIPTPSSWDTDLGFNRYTGSVEIAVWCWMPAKNDTWVQSAISIDTQTISKELGEQLSGSPKDRLVIFFTQPHGHMIAASHGKFYSHSDVDRRYINPFTNPPNLTQYHLWTCLQSNDTLIPQACRQLHDQYRSWTAIPTIKTELLLGSERYWVSVNLTTTALKCTVVMLNNREVVMGSIDASSTAVDDLVASKKTATFIVLGVVTAIAVFLPLAVGMWLATRLMKLAAGMDQVARLQFSVKHTPPTVFSELHHFQSSFTTMQRGLQVFSRFVPEAVVRVLIAGKMQATMHLGPQVLTVMFADIDDFSTICENETPATLVSVCTEYFEAMCINVTQCNGTVDKLIGDSIMAMWNAPEQRAGHEIDAAEAALGMQASVMHLHTTWQQRGLPILKFRLGIHTGMCLVGNFGCSLRINYTCLGDSVNFAARLEDLNRKFGTTICVSHTTYQACRGNFHFRQLAKVAVPGKAEAFPVFEMLYPVVGEAQGGSSHHFGGEDGVETIMIDQADGEHPKGRKRRDLDMYQPKEMEEREDTQPCLLSNEVPYHWRYVSRMALLAQATQYRAAYDAMVAGNLLRARNILNQNPTAIPDKAWQVLREELHHVGPTSLWDGVFHL